MGRAKAITHGLAMAWLGLGRGLTHFKLSKTERGRLIYVAILSSRLRLLPVLAILLSDAPKCAIAD
jgi:hypothetical protein